MAYKRAHVKKRFRPKPGRLLDQVREIMRYHHYAIRTEQTYVKWILDYIRFNGTRHPWEIGKPEIERFLSHLAVNRSVASSTQNQALNAILFLYKLVLDIPLYDTIEQPARKSRKDCRTQVMPMHILLREDRGGRFARECPQKSNLLRRWEASSFCSSSRLQKGPSVGSSRK